MLGLKTQKPNRRFISYLNFNYSQPAWKIGLYEPYKAPNSKPNVWQNSHPFDTSWDSNISNTPHVTYKPPCICMQNSMLCGNHVAVTAHFSLSSMSPINWAPPPIPSLQTTPLPLFLQTKSLSQLDIWSSMATKVVAALWLCLMVCGAMGQLTEKRLSYRAQQCRINRLTSSQPTQRIECDGGIIEMWDQNEEQYQCSGIHAMRVIIQPNSLHLPNFHPYPRLVYIERGLHFLSSLMSCIKGVVKTDAYSTCFAFRYLILLV